MSHDAPFAGPAPAEIPLPNAPLIRVIAALRFPKIVSIEKPSFIGPFQEALRAAYPVLRQEALRTVIIGPEGPSAGHEETVWRFTDVAGVWRLSLAPEFVALETKIYHSRQDLLDRLGDVLGALEAHIQPATVDRFGLRYVDRVVGDPLRDLPKLVRPEFLGFAALPLGAKVAHATAEALFELGKANLLARWVRLPANATYDPAGVEPVAEDSWVLDLDMFAGGGQQPFRADELVGTAEAFAIQLYKFFRWAVTDDFLRQYGGKL